jgi:perosamine synthetase
MLVTNDKTIGDKVKYLSCQAKTVTGNGGFSHDEVGYNYRMPNILAAIGVAQLENIIPFIQTKKANAAMYSELLKDVPGITLPAEKPWVENVQWLYSIVVENEYPLSRDDLIIRLKQNGVESRPFFIPIHTMAPYKDFPHRSMEITNELAARGINLPSSVSLLKEQIIEIVRIISEV